jgi:GNAT superfamily N-acetyltransferase
MSEKVDQLQIKIRPALEVDAPFIFNSWLRSFRENGLARPVNNEIYYSEQHKLIEKLLKRCTVSVACDPNDPTSIYGYICHEKIDGIFVLHYVYVKHPFRSLGLAKTLLLETKHNTDHAALYTHTTAAAVKLQQKFNMLYHPYLLINYEAK